jgi:hypothetical protein
MRERRPALGVLCSLALLFAAACGDSAKPPAAPEPVSNPIAQAGPPPPASPPTFSGEISLDEFTEVATADTGVRRPIVGIVSNLSGTCPSLTFVVTGITIQTDGRTVFEGGACADVKDGLVAGAVGTRTSSGALLAARLKVGPQPTPRPPKPPTPPTPPSPTPKPPRPPAPSYASVAGVVASVSSACPDLTLVIESTTVYLTRQTQFTGGTCADLRAGLHAAAKGTRRGDGSMDALHVTMRK